jgi:hypothetical protein
MARTLLASLTSARNLIARCAFDANGWYVDNVLDNPNVVAPVQLDPEGGLGGAFVFGDHRQLAYLFDVVSDFLCGAN